MIEVQSLTRYYGSHRAVDDVSFSISSSSVVGFLGLNGAGKSTVLKVLAGLLEPSSGTVRIDGVDMASAPTDFRRTIGFLPEDPPLHTEMTVREYLVWLGCLRGMSHSAVQARLPEVIQKTWLDEQADRVIGELSHGYRKRVGIAQAIIHGPKLVILDEPISGLDPRQIVEMRQMVKSLGEQSTVLISSHNLHEISHTCDRLLVLNEGKLVADGTEAQLASHIGSGRVLLLTLSAERDKVSSFLGARPDVVRFSIEGEQDGRVHLQVELKADDRERLVAGLVGAGFGVRRVEDAQDELEEIFIDLTAAPQDGAAGSQTLMGGVA